MLTDETYSAPCFSSLNDVYNPFTHTSLPCAATLPQNDSVALAFRNESVLCDPDRQLQLLIDSVRDHALYLLDPDGIVCSWNPGAERIKGYTSEEVVGSHFGRFYLPEDRAAGQPQRLLDMARANSRHADEGWRVRRDGSRFRASVVIEPVLENGVLLGFVKITHDVTESWQAQRLLQEAQRALRQTQKFEGVALLSRGLAHEFNNLLTTIGNALELVALRVGEDERAQALLDNAQSAADRGAHLTRQLLAFAAGQTLVGERIDLAALIRQWQPELQRACPAQVELQFALCSALPPVLLDPDQLYTALTNLVVNACEAMPEGGRIRITTGLEVRLDPDTCPAVRRHYVALNVCDDGRGMPPDIAERASEPFFTTKDIGKGSGLGLSQVFGFTTQSGGFVDVSSTAGIGTTVSLLLPALEDPAHD